MHPKSLPGSIFQTWLKDTEPKETAAVSLGGQIQLELNGWRAGILRTGLDKKTCEEQKYLQICLSWVFDHKHAIRAQDKKNWKKTTETGEPLKASLGHSTEACPSSQQIWLNTQAFRGPRKATSTEVQE